MAQAKLYLEKTAITAADMLNDRVIPFFDEQNVPLIRVLTDRGTEYCGNIESHSYQLYLAMEDVDHSKTKAHHPQINGICERFHKTMKNEFYDIAFRKKIGSIWILGRLRSSGGFAICGAGYTSLDGNLSADRC